MRLDILCDHWLTNAWSQKEPHLAMESDIVRRLLLKRKRVPSPGAGVANVSAPVPTGTPAQYNSRIPSDGMRLDWMSKPILPPEDVCCSTLLPRTTP